MKTILFCESVGTLNTKHQLIKLIIFSMSDSDRILVNNIYDMYTNQLGMFSFNDLLDTTLRVNVKRAIGDITVEDYSFASWFGVLVNTVHHYVAAEIPTIVLEYRAHETGLIVLASPETRTSIAVKHAIHRVGIIFSVIFTRENANRGGIMMLSQSMTDFIVAMMTRLVVSQRLNF